MSYPWYRSLIVQLGGALFLLFALAAGAVGFTLYELDLRKHDYVIMNLAGQLRVTVKGLVSESLLYRQYLAEQGELSPSQAETYLRTIRQPIEFYTRVIDSLRNRLLAPELTGRSEPLYCNWDEQSIRQLETTAGIWQGFRTGLERTLGPEGQAPRIGEAIDYITARERAMLRSTDELTRAFQQMMEGKMALISLINQGFLLFFFLLLAVLMFLFYLTFARPLARTVAGFSRVAQGDFGHQVAQAGRNEIGQMSAAFNRLSCRMRDLFRLTDRINQATNLDETLRFVFAEFRQTLPIEWVGLLTRSEDGTQFRLERLYTDSESKLREGELFTAEDSLLSAALKSRKPLHIPRLASALEQSPAAQFADRLARDGYGSALFFPLTNERAWGAVLVFAVAREQAYSREHLELLGNIAGQVTHGFEKTVVTENLVVSAITGLAKLAENRDPETGDHLIRMARYSAIIAEQLGRTEAYADQISADYVRDIERFAPMHDIGKVGVADSILLKPGRLDADERREMERHPVIGGEVLRRCEAQISAVGRSVFQLGIEIAEGHHEKYDGSGYPAGLGGEEIPLAARIVAAADVFDALTSRRPYKEAWSTDKARALMAEEAGRHFDPDVVAALEQAMPRILEVYARLKHV